MYVAKWRYGPDAEIDKWAWTDALQEALRISASDPNRDELLSLTLTETEG